MSIALSRFIDAARWIAALTVAVSHVGGLLYVFGAQTGAPAYSPVAAWLFWPSYAFAHEAVVVFFVLSGFLVGGAVLERVRTPRRWLRDYMIDRTVRIYIVLAPVLLLCGALDLIGARFLAHTGAYASDLYVETFKPWLVLTNLLNLQGTYFAPFGSNMPMWSLGLEYWYYIAFALMVLPFASAISAYPRNLRMAGGALGLAIALALSASGGYFFFGLAIWLLGALVRIAPAPVLRSRALALAAFLIVSVAVRQFVSETVLLNSPARFAVDAVEALLFANVLLALRFDETPGFAFARSAIHARVSAFSFTLYACHMPIIVFLWACCAALFGASWSKATASPAYYAIFVALALSVVAASYLLSRVTEAHTAAARARLRSRLDRFAAVRS